MDAFHRRINWDRARRSGRSKTSARSLRRLIMARRYRTAGISRNLSYTIREICEICGTSPQTLRRYIKSEGLPAMTAQKPFLINGGDYHDFIEGKRKRCRNTLKAGEFRCFSCGSISEPFGSMADYDASGFRPRLSALCGSCERPVSLLTSPAKLSQYRARLDITEGSPL